MPISFPDMSRNVFDGIKIYHVLKASNLAIFGLVLPVKLFSYNSETQ